MRRIISFAFLALFVFSILFTSCAKEETELISTEELNLKGNSSHDNGPVDKLKNDLALEWTDMFLVLDRYATGMRPNATSRALAYIYLASYETAVPGMRAKISNQEHLDGLYINTKELPHRLNYNLALNACFAKVIDHFLLHLPQNERNKIEELEEKNYDRLKKKLSSKEVNESIEWGRYVAEQVIEYSQTDLQAEEQILEPQPLSYEPPVGDGYWTYSADPERALFPYWESVRTFIISPDETSTIPPIEYSTDPNSSYFNQMKEVYETNNTAKEEENEQLWIAEFWSDDVEGLMMSPPARQFSIANQLVKQHKLNMSKTLSLFLKLGFSLNDAAVSTWKYKYQYMVMRPTEYVRVFIDPDFQTNLYKFIYWPNPSFPGYPSGHSCFASAAAGIFIDYFGNEVSFTDKTHEGRTEFLGTPRHFSTLEELASENAYSRIPLGVHVRMDCTEGLRLGYEIADAVNQYKLNKHPI